MEAVLATATEVASAMCYLHADNIVHGDLTAWNVMLTASGATTGDGGRGWVAKVGLHGGEGGTYGQWVLTGWLAPCCQGPPARTTVLFWRDKVHQSMLPVALVFAWASQLVRR